MYFRETSGGGLVAEVHHEPRGERKTSSTPTEILRTYPFFLLRVVNWPGKKRGTIGLGDPVRAEDSVRRK